MTVDHTTLLTLISVGNEEALHQLYLAYRPRLRPYLWRQFDGDMQAVEETLQEIFLAVWRSAGTYRGDGKVASWLFRIAHRMVIHKRRDEARYLNDISIDDPKIEDAFHFARGIGALEDVVVNRLALKDALQRLAPKHREVLDLVAHQGFSLEEAAHILDIPTGTVKSRLNYARKALTRELAISAVEEIRYEN